MIVEIILNMPVSGHGGNLTRFPIFGIDCKFAAIAIVGK